MRSRLRWAAAGLFLAALLPLAWFAHGWAAYLLNQRSILEKMDQYYMTIVSPGREQYLLENDELFEVPYMASKLSLEAEPTRIYDSQNRLIGEFSSEKGLYARDPEELPVFLRKALVAAEDGTFYRHGGVNFRATARALLVNLRHLSHRQGGSTLTQQLAKLLFTTRKKTYTRKIFEALCARRLESKFTKDQILLMYFNFAYFGHGNFGVESAARYYFGKTTRALDLAESALLVAVIPNPTRYSPFENPELARARHKTVLSRMSRLGMVPAGSIDRLLSEFWTGAESRFKAQESSFWRMTVNAAPYLVERVRRDLERHFSRERILKGGLRVRTTFDLDVQKAAEAALRPGLRAENPLIRSTGTAKSPVEGALAAVRPSDGAVLALVGGSGFHFKNQLDRSMDIARPIGSSVKPFIFALAFEKGLRKPEDMMTDKPLRLRMGPGKWWEPKNYDGKFFGEVTLSTALHKSLNSVAIQLLQELELKDVKRLLGQATGLPEEGFPHNLSLALGTFDVPPLALARAYAMLANNGRAAGPYWLIAVEDREGHVLREGPAPPEPVPVLSTQTCRTMIAVLRGVLGPGGSAHGAALRTGFNAPAFGKTGTTNDYRDAWFAGATPDIAAAVWLGHDDMRRTLGPRGTGGGMAAPIWMTFMKEAYRHRPTREFE